MLGDFHSDTERLAENGKVALSDDGLPCAIQGPGDLLLDVVDLAAGTMVAQATLHGGAPIGLARPDCTRAVLVLVCLDPCPTLSLSRAGEPRLVSPVSAGSVFLLDPRERHVLQASGSVRVLCFGIHYKALDHLIRRSEATRMVSPAALLDGETFFFDETVRDLAISVRSMVGSDTSNGLFLEQVTFAVAAHLLLRRCSQEHPPAWRGGLAPWQLARAKSLVMADLAKTVQANVLAKACGLSPSHFSRAFRRSTGTSPHAWLVDRRIAHAKHLMRSSDARLADIALECGFADQSHLTRVFTREEGISPGSWRRYAGPAASLAKVAAAEDSEPRLLSA